MAYRTGDMKSTDVLFQAILALIGIVAGIAVPLLRKNYQRWMAVASAILLISLAAYWAGYEVGQNAATNISQPPPQYRISITHPKNADTVA